MGVDGKWRHSSRDGVMKEAFRLRNVNREPQTCLRGIPGGGDTGGEGLGGGVLSDSSEDAV